MREIRLALLEADVNFKVVKSFTTTVKERCLGADVLGTLNPGQQVVKIVDEELAKLMGGASVGVTFSPRPPTVIVMAGLQGSGKTTATAKLARYLKSEHGSSVAVAACDVYRPAAVDQLIKVGTQAGADVYEQGTDRDPVKIAAWARDRAQSEGKDVLIIDTSGRLHVDQELMAQRILGMGDVMTLIEKAQGAYDDQQAAELERKLRKQEFGLDDFLDQLRQIRRLGPLQSLLGMIPGLGKELRGVKVEEREFDRIQAVILSMTPQERRHPELINGSRRLRIARGSGTNVHAVKQLIKQFEQMRKVMRQVSQGRMPDLGAMMRQVR